LTCFGSLVVGAGEELVQTLDGDGLAEVAAIDPCNRMAPEGGVAHSLAEMVIDGLGRSIELNGYWFSGSRLSFLSRRYLTDEL